MQWNEWTSDKVWKIIETVLLFNENKFEETNMSVPAVNISFWQRSMEHICRGSETVRY